MTGTLTEWDAIWGADGGVLTVWESLSLCGWGLQLVLLFCVAYRSLENRRWLLLFSASLLLPVNLLATCCFRFPGFPSHFSMLWFTLGLIGLASLVSFVHLFPLWLPAGHGLFRHSISLSGSDRGETAGCVSEKGMVSAQTGCRRHFTFLLPLLAAGWMLLSGTGSVLAQGGSGTPASPPPSTGTPSTGTPSTGTPPGNRKPRQQPRRVKRPKADKAQIKALSMVGFLTNSVRYIRDSLGPAVIMQLRKLQPAFVALAYGLLVIISLFTLWRMASESDDASAIPAFVLRMIICGVLIGLSSLIVQTLFQVGFIWTSSGAVQDMVGATELGAPGGGFSMPDTSQPPQLPSGDTDVQITTYELRYLNAIDEWRRNSKERFITGLEAFRQSKLKVRITQSRFFDPKDSGLEYFVPDFSRAGKDGFVHQFLVGLNPKNWSPLQLYSALEASILVMQVGIFTGWILLVFVMPFAELLAPVFFSVAIDKGKLFDQMTMPFIRGLITASLIMPLVNIILEGIAYNVASLGFSVFDIKDGKKGTEIFQWDPATEQIVATADPTVLVFTSCFFILISGLSLILSPVIAYRIMSGEIFGAAVGAISGWTAGLVSLGISAVSQGAGASFQRQAEHLSNVGSYQSAAASAGASAKAAHIRNEAEYLSTLSQIRQTMATNVNSAMMDLPMLTGTGYSLSGLVDGAMVTSLSAAYEYKLKSHSENPNSSGHFTEEERREIEKSNPNIVFRNGKPYERSLASPYVYHPMKTTDPRLVRGLSVPENHQKLAGQLQPNNVALAGSLAQNNLLFHDSSVAKDFRAELPPTALVLINPQGSERMIGDAKYLGGVTDKKVLTDLTNAINEAHANPGKQTFTVAGHDLNAAQLKELRNYYTTGLSVSPEIVKEIANGATVNHFLTDPRLHYELYMSGAAYTNLGRPYEQWVQIAVAGRNAEVQVEVAEIMKDMQDEAADIEYGGQVGAAAINFRYSEMAAALRARWQFIQGTTATIQSVLARQIENNRV